MNLIEKVELFLESKKISNKLEDHFKKHYMKYTFGAAALLGGAKYIDKKKSEVATKNFKLDNLKRAVWRKHHLENKKNLTPNEQYELNKSISYLKDNSKDQNQSVNIKNMEDFLNKHNNLPKMEKFKKFDDIVDEYKEDIKNGTNFIVRQFIN